VAAQFKEWEVPQIKQLLVFPVNKAFFFTAYLFCCVQSDQTSKEWNTDGGNSRKRNWEFL